MLGLWGGLSLVFLVTPSAPEHFGDTILFTTDDDILEAIFCSDETFDAAVESLCDPPCEEALRRPSTADGEGQERPHTQAGLWAEGRVGRAGASQSSLLLTRPRAGARPGLLEAAGAAVLTVPVSLLQFGPVRRISCPADFYSIYLFFHQSAESWEKPVLGPLCKRRGGPGGLLRVAF